jgi:hypothetical protein
MPYMTTKCTLAMDSFKRVPHNQPGRNRTVGIVGSFLAVSKRY